MKVIFVELPYEACEIAVFEVFRKDVFRELLVLSRRQNAVTAPALFPNILPVQQSYRHRRPISLRFHLAGSPAS